MSEPTPTPLTGVVPYLSVVGGQKALDFYKRAFGAEVNELNLADDGQRVLNAQFVVNGGSVMLSDDFPEYRGGGAAPAAAGVTLHLHVDDADAWFNRAVEAGATVRMPLADQFWGDRYGQLTDPFGHTWSVGSAIKG